MLPGIGVWGSKERDSGSLEKIRPNGAGGGSGLTAYFQVTTVSVNSLLNVKQLLKYENFLKVILI